MLPEESPSAAADAPGQGLNFGYIPPSAAAQSQENKKKKKKKRSLDDDQIDSKDNGQKAKKRKPDESHILENSSVEEVIPPANVDSSENDASSKKTKKKKEKGKEKEKVSPSAEPHIDAEVEAQASAAALLSAIVATMSNPQAPPQPPPVAPFNPQMPPFPGNQIPYGAIPMFHLPHEFQNGVHPPPMFPYPFLIPGPNGVPIPDATFGSNEDVLRALQDLDMSKIQNALRSLGEGFGLGPFPGFPHPQMPFAPPPLPVSAPLEPQQADTTPPSISNRFVTVPPKITKKGSQKRTLDMSLAPTEQSGNAKHAHLLAHKWLNPNKLAELVKTEGLVYRKGKFSAIEEQQLKGAIEKYQHEKQISYEQLIELIFAKSDKTKDATFWSEITVAVPLRPIIAVYHHVRRSYHPMQPQGEWKTEDDQLLIQAITDVGQQWEKVSDRVRRRAADCRDRYRNHIINKDIRITGVWSKEEEEQLTQIVTDMTVNKGKDIDNDVFWGKVSELMGGKRGRQQCRIKWTDALSKTVKNEGQKPRWSQQDAYILVHKVDSLNVRDDTEIDWKLISDPDWNLWSAHTLQRRWLTLKRSVKGHEDMTHQDIMEILRLKKAHLPAVVPTAIKKRKERKVTSAAAVTEIDSRDSNAATPEAGSSTGAGTLNDNKPQGIAANEDNLNT